MRKVGITLTIKNGFKNRYQKMGANNNNIEHVIIKKFYWNKKRNIMNSLT